MQDNDIPKHRPYLYQIGDTFATQHGTMTVIDRSRTYSNQVFRKQYTLQCEKGHQYTVKEAYLKAGRLKTCKKCNHPVIIETDPAFASWFVDQTIPRTHPHGSHDQADFYCPQCGKIVRGKSINNVYKRQQVPCPYCSNGVSYPERYVTAFFEQLQIPFMHQYTVRFTRNQRRTHYKYDFYDPVHKLVIETHGQQHYEPGAFERFGGQTLEQIQQTDAEKARYAVQILGMQYIALDCRRSDPNWIRREIIQKLCLYPLETVDWNAVRQSANQSVILQMIQLSKQGYTQKQIGEIVHMNPSTVCSKLRKAQKDGLYDGITPQLLRREEQKQLREAQQKAKEQKQAEQRERARAAHLRFTLLCKTCGQAFTSALPENDRCPQCQKLEALQQKLLNKYGDEYEILSLYSNCRTPLKIRHKLCGQVFHKASNELLKRGCTACARRQRAKPKKPSISRQQQSKEKFFSLLPEFERRGYPYAGLPFQGFGKPNAFRCRHCNQLWWTTANSILKGRQHICISPCRKKTPEEFVRQVYELVGDEYSVLDEYQTAFTPIRLRHNTCGLEYLVSPIHFTSTGRRCPACTDSRPEGILNDIWNQKCADVAAFRAQHGHSDVPYGYQVNGYNLGEWLGDQRKLYRRGRLPQERIQKLEALGIRWNCKEDDWKRAYQEVRNYLQAHGPAHLRKDSSKDERRCYYWIQDQIKRGRKGRLSQEKLALLRAIGINLDYYTEAHFNAMCDKLRCFAEKNGHCIVPLDEGIEGDEPLGLWAQRMRQQMAAGTLSADRIKCLTQIGLPSSNQAAKFQRKLAYLTAYYQKHGHLQIPQSYTENGQRLGKWINVFRVSYAKGSLPAEQSAALEAIGMLWSAK